MAAEAATEEAVKQLIVATPGVQNEKEWEQSLTTSAGGVVTVQSELGEPICDAMLEVGIARLGFKPGTAGAIAQVVDIAHRNPKMTIVLQWTGGRSGGHHSQVRARTTQQMRPLLLAVSVHSRVAFSSCCCCL